MNPSARTTLTALTVFAALTLLWLQPLWMVADTHLTELYDARLNAWVLAWNAHAIEDPEADLFDANIFHPFGSTLAFSENLLVPALLVAPFNLAGEPVLAYNIALFLGFVLTGAAMTLWLRELTGNTLTAIFGAIAFVYGSSRADHLAHLQLLVTWWVPLILLCTHRWVQSRRVGWLVAAGAAGGLQFLSGINATLVFLPAISIYGVGSALHVAERRPRASRLLRQVTAAALVALLLAAPMALPYLEVSREFGFTRSLDETRPYSAQAHALMAPSVQHGGRAAQWLHARYGAPEANHFPGAAVLSLLIIGGLSTLRRRPPNAPTRRTGFRIARGGLLISGGALVLSVVLAPWQGSGVAERSIGLLATLHPALWVAGFTVACFALWRPAADSTLGDRLLPALLCGALISWLLAMGPEVRASEVSLGTGPFSWLWELATPFRSLRAVGRFGFATSFCLAAAAAIVAERLLRRLPHRTVAVFAAAMLAALAFVENRLEPIAPRRALPTDTSVFERLAALPGDGGVLHVPLEPSPVPASTTLYQLASTLHWKPLANGYSGFFPPSILALRGLRPLEPEFLEHLRSQLAVDWIVLHRDLMSPEEWSRIRARADASGDLELEFENETGAIYRFESMRRRGATVTWHFRADQLKGVSAIVAEYRAVGAVGGEAHWILNGRQVAVTPTSSSWVETEILLPGDLQPAGDGTYELTLGHLERPSNGGLPAGIVVDAQEGVRSVAIGPVWLSRQWVAPLLAVELDPGTGTVRRELGTSASRFGIWRLRRFLDAVSDTGWVAVAIRPSGDAVIESPALARQLARLGADLPEGARYRALAVLGSPGLAPGEALMETSGSRAFVRVASDATGPTFVVRRLEPLSHAAR